MHFITIWIPPAVHFIFDEIYINLWCGHTLFNCKISVNKFILCFLGRFSEQIEIVCCCKYSHLIKAFRLEQEGWLFRAVCLSVNLQHIVRFVFKNKKPCTPHCAKRACSCVVKMWLILITTRNPWGCGCSYDTTQLYHYFPGSSF